MSARDPEVTALLAATRPDESRLSRLHATLVTRASDEGLLDVAYTTMDSPIGELLLASTASGLARIAFANEDFDDVLEHLAARLGPRILHAPHALREVERELDEYFDGSRREFDLNLDLALSAGFRQLVQQQLAHIDYGKTRSYQQVAESVGNPKASRAVGSACATNPLPIVLPCHRVLRSDGSLGGYSGGLEAKRILLALEHAA